MKMKLMISVPHINPPKIHQQIQNQIQIHIQISTNLITINPIIINRIEEIYQVQILIFLNHKQEMNTEMNPETNIEMNPEMITEMNPEMITKAITADPLTENQ